MTGYWWCRTAPGAVVAYARNLRAERRYRKLSEAEIKSTRTSETAFIFGCSYSINDITPDEWQAIARHDTIGASELVYVDLTVGYHAATLHYNENHRRNVRKAATGNAIVYARNA